MPYKWPRFEFGPVESWTSSPIFSTPGNRLHRTSMSKSTTTDILRLSQEIVEENQQYDNASPSFRMDSDQVQKPTPHFVVDRLNNQTAVNITSLNNLLQVGKVICRGGHKGEWFCRQHPTRHHHRHHRHQLLPGDHRLVPPPRLLRRTQAPCRTTHPILSAGARLLIAN